MKLTNQLLLRLVQKAEGWVAQLWKRDQTDAKGRLIAGTLVFQSEPKRRKELAINQVRGINHE